MWYVYILKCADGTFYTGVTTDVDRRLEEHNSSPLGAKYTKGRRPVKLAFSKKIPSISQATVEEARIKKLSRKDKQDLIKH